MDSSIVPVITWTAKPGWLMSKDWVLLPVGLPFAQSCAMDGIDEKLLRRLIHHLSHNFFIPFAICSLFFYFQTFGFTFSIQNLAINARKFALYWSYAMPRSANPVRSSASDSSKSRKAAAESPTGPDGKFYTHLTTNASFRMWVFNYALCYSKSWTPIHTGAANVQGETVSLLPSQKYLRQLVCKFRSVSQKRAAKLYILVVNGPLAALWCPSAVFPFSRFCAVSLWSCLKRPKLQLAPNSG